MMCLVGRPDHQPRQRMGYRRNSTRRTLAFHFGSKIPSDRIPPTVSERPEPNVRTLGIDLEGLYPDIYIRYFIWSGWANGSSGNTQNLYIAKMSSPTQISGNRVLLHEPTPAWQKSGGSAINEGPEILVHNGRTFLVYCESPPCAYCRPGLRSGLTHTMFSRGRQLDR